jgi:Outer membrane protein and related peptidoglycan-associated (lipo)proteins
MRMSNTRIQLIGVALVLALSGAVFAQDGNASGQQPGASSATQTRTVANGQKLKIEGIVIRRAGDTFTLRGSNGTETEVVLTAKTRIKTERKGLFRVDKDSGASEIVRGLRLKAEGTGNSDGRLVAKEVRFDEQDLRTAQSLESRVDPVENQAKSTEALAQSNEKRIDTAEQRIDASEENAQRLAGQVEELSVVADSAGAAAKNAQTTADQAQSTADVANQRINALDDYDVLKTFTVHFKSGSAVLSAAAKTQLDEAVSDINENLKGWLVVVEGYADSRGNTANNRSLSERRANAVINYLVTKHDLPIRRVVQPFGYGSLDPIATNTSRSGRSLNRRAEITVLVNQGISSQSGSQRTASEDPLSRRP